MKLTQTHQNSYKVNCRRKFHPMPLTTDILEKSFEFAKAMVFGEGFHRNHRSGGEHIRRKGELFANTFQGKLAEFIVYEELVANDLKDITIPDVGVYGKGKWDDVDLCYCDKKLNIKSCAHFSQLLLLEQKDWNAKGEYIPNLDQASSARYDYFIMVRLKPDIKRLLQKKKWFYRDDVDILALKELIFQQKWYYDYGGICTHKTLQYIICNKYILPKGACLNGSTHMDASNYYIQCGDMKKFDFLITKLKDL